MCLFCSPHGLFTCNQSGEKWWYFVKKPEHFQYLNLVLPPTVFYIFMQNLFVKITFAKAQRLKSNLCYSSQHFNISTEKTQSLGFNLCPKAFFFLTCISIFHKGDLAKKEV